MLFYAKRHAAFDLLVIFVLGGAGLWGIRAFAIPVRATATPEALGFGVAGALLIAGWTVAVQQGYRIARGSAYAKALTASLARNFAEASWLQVLLGGVAAAVGEEVFFRGFVQGQWGILAGAVAFMIAHIGGRDIRIIGFWSLAQGLLLGVFYQATGNLLVPMVAHALFDMGAMVHFRRIMAGKPQPS
jgi:membrane protease YdiL (CAAX protease family)